MLLIAAEGSDWWPHFTKWEGPVCRGASWQQLSGVKGTGQAPSWAAAVLFCRGCQQHKSFPYLWLLLSVLDSTAETSVHLDTLPEQL